MLFFLNAMFKIKTAYPKTTIVIWIHNFFKKRLDHQFQNNANLELFLK